MAMTFITFEITSFFLFSLSFKGIHKVTNEKQQRWQFVLVCDGYENVTGDTQNLNKKAYVN